MKKLLLLRASFTYYTLLLIISACSTIEVSKSYDTTYDFSKLKTYDWIPVENKKHALVAKQLQNELKNQLAAKGFRHDDAKPDLLIALHGGTEEIVSIRNNYRGYHYGNWYGGSRGSLHQGGGIDVYEYEEGTLILDIIDAKSKELVFRSITTKEISKNPSMEKRLKNIKNVIMKAIKSFPPDTKKK